MYNILLEIIKSQYFCFRRKLTFYKELMELYVFANLSTQAGCDTRSIFKQSWTGLNSEFCFSYTGCLTKAKKPGMPYYLPIAGGRKIEFIPFPKVLMLCEMQRTLFWIWIRVAMSISYDDNHYTMDTSIDRVTLIYGHSVNLT